MRKGLLAGSPPLTCLIMLVFSMAACFMLVMLAGILLSPAVLGVKADRLMELVGSGEATQHLGIMRYLQTLQGVGLFIVPAFFAAYLFSGNAAGYLGLGQTARVKWFGATLLLTFAAMPCINLTGALNEMIVFPKILSGLEQRLKYLEEAARKATGLFLETDSVGAMFFNIFMMALLPALGEEFIFRGLLQKILIRWTGNAHAGVIVSGFLFSLMHMQFYGFLPRWLLGVMFGYLLVWSGTIWLPVFAHFVNNAAIVYLSFLIHRGTLSEDIETFGTACSELPVTVAATALCVWLLLKIKRYRTV